MISQHFGGIKSADMFEKPRPTKQTWFVQPNYQKFFLSAFSMITMKGFTASFFKRFSSFPE